MCRAYCLSARLSQLNVSHTGIGSERDFADMTKISELTEVKANGNAIDLRAMEGLGDFKTMRTLELQDASRRVHGDKYAEMMLQLSGIKSPTTAKMVGPMLD